MRDFHQEGPSLRNQYESDGLLRQHLNWRLPAEILSEIEPGLRAFGGRVVGDVFQMARDAEAVAPRHIPFDPWGRRVDRIEVAPAWDGLARVSAEEGLVAIAYERAHGAYSRLHQFAKLYLFHPSSAFFSCPLAMTDGAARTLELNPDVEMKGSDAFRNLTTRNPQRFWTSGQWMTERTGGSDVSETSTFATFDAGVWRLSGDKWFTSATTSQMALALARTEPGQTESRGLSLFALELRDRDGRLREIEILRLKDKLGTKALPTAELRLRGTPARLIGSRGAGVRTVASLLNITRLHNSVCAVAQMARGLALARDYAQKRRVFGRRLAEQPLHVRTLAEQTVEFEGCFHLTFHMALLLGREESGIASLVERAVLRVLTPVTKLWTARQAVRVCSEVLESFGGAGYIEDTGIPRLLRDTQVFSIWEGTTNVLALDVQRALSKDDAGAAVVSDIESRLEKVSSASLQAEVSRVRAAALDLASALKAFDAVEPDERQTRARDVAFGLARIYAASLLLEFAEWASSRKTRPVAETVAKRWCAGPLLVWSDFDPAARVANDRIVFD